MRNPPVWMALDARLRQSTRCSGRACAGVGSVLGVARLIELDREAARHLEMGDQPVAPFYHRSGELDAARGELGDRLLDVVAVEGDVVAAGRRAVSGVGGMATQV